MRTRQRSSTDAVIDIQLRGVMPFLGVGDEVPASVGSGQTRGLGVELDLGIAASNAPKATDVGEDLRGTNGPTPRGGSTERIRMRHLASLL